MYVDTKQQITKIKKMKIQIINVIMIESNAEINLDMRGDVIIMIATYTVEYSSNPE